MSWSELVVRSLLIIKIHICDFVFININPLIVIKNNPAINVVCCAQSPTAAYQFCYCSGIDRHWAIWIYLFWYKKISKINVFFYKSVGNRYVYSWTTSLAFIRLLADSLLLQWFCVLLIDCWWTLQYCGKISDIWCVKYIELLLIGNTSIHTTL